MGINQKVSNNHQLCIIFLKFYSHLLVEIVDVKILLDRQIKQFIVIYLFHISKFSTPLSTNSFKRCSAYCNSDRLFVIIYFIYFTIPFNTIYKFFFRQLCYLFSQKANIWLLPLNCHVIYSMHRLSLQKPRTKRWEFNYYHVATFLHVYL